MADHEELQPGESVLKHLIAGAMAGTAEHCVMFPVDTIKTIMQASGASSTSIGSTMRGIVAKGGIKSLFSGISAIASGAAPAHAMHFATYEFAKERFSGSRDGHQPLPTAAAGICATIVSDAIMTPMDNVKQRMQLGARNYSGMTDCIKTVVKTEGLSALYASYSTTLVMNVPYNAFYFATYESLRRIFKGTTDDTNFQVWVHCLAGGGAGAFASALTTPFDVAKTRLQTQGDVLGSKKYTGMYNTLVTIAKEEGKRGLLSGIKPRVILNSTSAAICWVTYEYVKYFLGKIGIE
eukprot:TRINITY_DN178_c0_g1_i1.p1 TRINITY_DN178_c0_g1~~TRINITY_DN178_c0_g1_i1.p1  ORF type:complete len:294 (-),score=31.39 TRINITY_DN178_c0_g1_i1:218-1099(-)